MVRRRRIKSGSVLVSIRGSVSSVPHGADIAGERRGKWKVIAGGVPGCNQVAAARLRDAELGIGEARELVVQVFQPANQGESAQPCREVEIKAVQTGRAAVVNGGCLQIAANLDVLVVVIETSKV